MAITRSEFSVATKFVPRLFFTEGADPDLQEDLTEFVKNETAVSSEFFLTRVMIKMWVASALTDRIFSVHPHLRNLIELEFKGAEPDFKTYDDVVDVLIKVNVTTEGSEAHKNKAWNTIKDYIKNPKPKPKLEVDHVSSQFATTGYYTTSSVADVIPRKVVLTSNSDYPPANGTVGDLWYHPDTNITRTWDGTRWVTLDQFKKFK